MIVQDKMVLDSVRTIDSNGYMHVAVSNITKEQVAPYLGSSIPNWQELGLEAGKVYQIYRSGEEIEKAVDTFNGLPLMLDHWDMDADHIPKEAVVGSLGTDAKYEKPYLTNSLIITDSKAIKAIEDGSYAEISASYACDIAMTGGVFNGTTYDGIMRGIQGNHVALVSEGRAGHDVRVADQSIPKEGGKKMDKWEKLKMLLKEVLTGEEAQDADEEIIEATEEEKAETNALPEEEVEVKEETKDEEPVDEMADEIRELMTKAGLDPEDKSQQKAFLAGMAVAKEEVTDACGKDEAEEVVEVKTAQDKAIHDKAFYAGLYKACNDVAPLIGRIKNPFTFDSAEDIYAKALKKKGYALDGIDPSAYAGMVAVLNKQNKAVPMQVDDDPLNKALRNIKSL